MLIKPDLIYPLTRGLPKTGQTVSYRSGDDGQYEAGWWVKLTNGNNRERFILHPVYPTALVIDRATGLMWPRNGNSYGGNEGGADIWQEAVDWAQGLNWADYTDWRLPNVRELASIADYAHYNPAVDTTIFSNIQSGSNRYWTSTTYKDNTGYAWVCRFDCGLVSYNIKTDSNYMLAVRGGV